MTSRSRRTRRERKLIVVDEGGAEAVVVPVEGEGVVVGVSKKAISLLLVWSLDGTEAGEWCFY